MDLDSKRLLAAVAPPEGLGSSRRVSISEDEALRSYLESPLTAATRAMMSINGDEDSVAALGLLYDFYKHGQVPRERRKPDYGSLDLVSHVQALGSMPVNLSRSYSENQGYRVEVDGSGKGTDDAPLALIKTECPTYTEAARGQRGTKQSCYRLSLTGYLKEEQSSSPHSTEEEEEGELSQTYLRSLSAGIQTSHSSLPTFRYNLDAGISFRPLHGDGPMAYLNRGQFYALTLSEPSFRASLSLHKNNDPGSLSSGEQRTGIPELPQDSVVQSVVMVVFGEEKGEEEQLKNWKYWHSRQHTAKQRVLDIADYKDSFNSIGNVEEVAYNAVSFTWDMSEGTKVFISVNCLSTDFSSQKGVKGTPLIIQIDTYSYNCCSTRPIHRAFTQIKVFCDKGAERKLRDEERKQLKKRMKGKDGNSGPATPLKKNDTTLFKKMLDLDSNPVLFIPDVHFGNLQRAGQVFAYHTVGTGTDGSLMKRVSCAGENDGRPQAKKSKVDVERKVLLYVRREGDEVFDALMLQSPTLKALMDAISEKYAVPVSKMAKVYQKSKRGLLVNMDDNLIQHLSNEDTFILTIESSADSLRVTLSEILGSELAQ